VAWKQTGPIHTARYGKWVTTVRGNSQHNRQLSFFSSWLSTKNQKWKSTDANQRKPSTVHHMNFQGKGQCTLYLALKTLVFS